MLPFTAFRLIAEHRFGLLTLALLGGATGCVKQTIVTPPINEVTIQIVGTVTEASSGLAISDALAEVRDLTTGSLFAETLTDSTGAYALSFLYRYFEGDRNFCPFLFLVSATGYTGDTPGFDCVDGVQTIDIQLESLLTDF